MTKRLFIFGLGFTGLRLARAMQLLGWSVAGSVTSLEKAEWVAKFGIQTFAFDGNKANGDITAFLKQPAHILSTVPPVAGADTVLECHADDLDHSWVSYLSTTGVYGHTDGAWVDETSPALGGTNEARQKADEAWRRLSGCNVFRLPGIYGPGRSVLSRAEKGQLSRVDKPGHVFSRIHVDDIVQTLIASIDKGSRGEIYNVADNMPAPAHEVEDYACALLGQTPPPLKSYENAALSKRAREFYSQYRRVKNEKIKVDLGVKLIYPTYIEGLQSCFAERQL